MKGNQENNPPHFPENLESRALNDLEKAQLEKIQEFLKPEDERLENILTRIVRVHAITSDYSNSIQMEFEADKIEEIKVVNKILEVGEIPDVNEIPVVKEIDEKKIKEIRKMNQKLNELKQFAKVAQGIAKDMESQIKVVKKQIEKRGRFEEAIYFCLDQKMEAVEVFKKAIERLNNRIGELEGEWEKIPGFSESVKAYAQIQQTPEAKKVFNQILSKFALLLSFIYGGGNIFSGGEVAATQPKMNATEGQEEVEMVPLHSRAPTSSEGSYPFFQDSSNGNTNRDNAVNQRAQNQDKTDPPVPWLRF